MPRRGADDLDRLVSIVRLKRRFLTGYEPGEAIREVILREPDQLTRRELLEKLPTWITLLRLAEGLGQGGENVPTSSRR